MRCSLFSFSSASSSFSKSRSASTSAPRGRVPAIGLVTTRRPCTCTSDSGEDPTIWKAVSDIDSSGTLTRNMYGLGLVIRSMR